MKKLLSVVLLAAASSAASAATITLEPAACVNTLCNPVPNAAGRDIYVSYPIASDGVSRNVSVSIDGIVYSYRALLANTGFSNVVLYSPLDGYIIATVEFDYWTTKQCSGRGGCKVTGHYMLVGGSVVTP